MWRRLPESEKCDEYLRDTAEGTASIKNAGGTDEELVAGASSYSYYDGGIEIQIDTREDYRRKGLAYVCASALMLECLKRGLYPGWDAQNLVSAKLAGELGYQYAGEYVAYEVIWK